LGEFVGLRGKLLFRFREDLLTFFGIRTHSRIIHEDFEFRRGEFFLELGIEFLVLVELDILESLRLESFLDVPLRLFADGVIVLETVRVSFRFGEVFRHHNVPAPALQGEVSLILEVLIVVLDLPDCFLRVCYFFLECFGFFGRTLFGLRPIRCLIPCFELGEIIVPFFQAEVARDVQYIGLCFPELIDRLDFPRGETFLGEFCVRVDAFGLVLHPLL